MRQLIAAAIIFLCTAALLPDDPESASLKKAKKEISKKYEKKPSGALVCPVTKLDTTSKSIALTLDACGGSGGSEYDVELIAYLRKEKVPATLFVNTRWMKKNKAIFAELSKDPLFEIESHGRAHRPATVNGRVKYGIRGTKSINELVEEVVLAAREIEKESGRHPHFFRAGTAWYDETAITIIEEELGYEIVNYDINSRDYSEKQSAEKIASYVLGAKEGSIVIMHMNHPSWNTKEALEIAIPVLKKRGYSFVKISKYPLVTKY